MENDPRTEPLKEWNRLARENTENAMVSSMFIATTKANDPIENFATWLLAGAAAVASFFITNADKIIPLVGKTGFLTCGALLCLSCIWGLLTKTFSLLCKIGTETSGAITQTFQEHFLKYQDEEKKIQEGAEFWGINLQTGIRIERILSEFYAAQPKWMVWLANRHIQKNANNPQVGHLLTNSTLNNAYICTFVQALSFLGFLVAGFAFAATI